MKKIIEIDTDLVCIVPIKDTKAMREAFYESQFVKDNFSVSYAEMLNQVPTILPGVVEYSGEPMVLQGRLLEDDHWVDLPPDVYDHAEANGFEVRKLFAYPSQEIAALQTRLYKLSHALWCAEVNADGAKELAAETIRDLKSQVDHSVVIVKSKMNRMADCGRCAELDASTTPADAFRIKTGGGYHYIDSLKGEEERFVQLWEKLYTHPPLTNAAALSIAQSTLNAAANVCDEAITRWGYENVRICAEHIRSLDLQNIINASMKEQK